jgi:hypothetical protein
MLGAVEQRGQDRFPRELFGNPRRPGGYAEEDGSGHPDRSQDIR